MTTNTAAKTKAKCEFDGAEVHYLPSYLAEKHGMSVEEYLAKHPGARLESDALTEAFASGVRNLTRKAPTPREELKINLAGLELPVNWDVSPLACLPLPDHYKVPEHGDLAEDIKRAARYFAAGRSFWAHGDTGSGKDAWPSALCAYTRTPSEIYPVNPDTDIMAWFFDKTFEHGKTEWVFGSLFNALVHGHVSPASGRRIPMTIVLSDFDRAGPAQAEAIRLVADTIQGRVKGPRGETYLVLPGTRIIITANTMGRGDATGKCISANVLDTSIINRIERKVLFHQLDWRDEEIVIRAKFPLFTERCADLLEQVGKATVVLRNAVANQNLHAEFSHRDLCTWIGDCEDMLRMLPNPPANLLQEGFKSYCDGLPDADTRVVAQGLVNAYLKGGALPMGNTSHVQPNTPLSI